MRVVGLTEGIGSGKTAVSDHFERLGITVVDADLASRQVVEPGSRRWPPLETLRTGYPSGRRHA